jgi:hypothetical protein
MSVRNPPADDQLHRSVAVWALWSPRDAVAREGEGVRRARTVTIVPLVVAGLVLTALGPLAPAALAHSYWGPGWPGFCPAPLGYPVLYWPRGLFG